MIKVSIVVPVYNVEKYLPECLDSIIGQTLKDIEIICINDGSPDNSLSILKNYAVKDSRIKIIDKKNEGVGKARNDGMRAATGEFIAFMDSDDFYPSANVLEMLYNSAKENNVKVAGGRKISFYPNGRKEISSYPFVDSGIEFTASGKTTYKGFEYDYGYWQFIYDRKMLIENDCFFPPYKRFQDPPFYVKAMNIAECFFAADIESYCYRVLMTEEKYTAEKSLDWIKGFGSNLVYSKENGLSKLHYLTAKRLDKEGSCMTAKNLKSEQRFELISEFIKTMSAVDTEWLREEGYDIKEPFVPELFEYLVTTAVKYENLRNKKPLKAVSKLLGR